MNIIDTATDTSAQVKCMASKGVKVIFRYYAPSPNWKVIKTTEAEAISNAGIQIGAVFENGSNLASFTEESGYNDAISAYTYARETIGQPLGSAIYFAVDLNVTDDEISSNIIPYFKGIHKGLKASKKGVNYNVGAYGCGAVVNTLLENGLCKYRWLSESSSFNGTSEALENGAYEIAQQFKQGLEICTISIDQDFLRDGVTDIGTFTLKDDSSNQS